MSTSTLSSHSSSSGSSASTSTSNSFSNRTHGHHKMGLFNSVKEKLSRKEEDTPARRLRADMTAAASTTKQSPGQASSSRASGTQQARNPGSYGVTSPPTRRPNPSGLSVPGAHPNEPPPAYTPSPASSPTPSAIPSAPPTTTTTDDAYSFLSTFNTVFLIDDSGSMAGRSWRETSSALRVIAPICTAHDADGVEIHFLNHADSVEYHNITSSNTVSQIFDAVRPAGGTPTGIRLHHLLKPYLATYESEPDRTKPLNIIVITDGVPSDDVESVIIAAARKLDRLDAPAWQVGIQFFQVGNEPGAREALQDLDDNLAEIAAGAGGAGTGRGGAGGAELRDMVDTIPYEAMTTGQLDGRIMLKAVLGAVTRRYDRIRT